MKVFVEIFRRTGENSFIYFFRQKELSTFPTFRGAGILTRSQYNKESPLHDISWERDLKFRSTETEIGVYPNRVPVSSRNKYPETLVSH